MIAYEIIVVVSHFLLIHIRLACHMCCFWLDLLDNVKQEFLQVQFQATHQLNSSLTHPKLNKIVLLTSQWWNSSRRRRKRKKELEKV